MRNMFYLIVIIVFIQYANCNDLVNNFDNQTDSNVPVISQESGKSVLFDDRDQIAIVFNRQPIATDSIDNSGGGGTWTADSQQINQGYQQVPVVKRLNDWQRNCITQYSDNKPLNTNSQYDSSKFHPII